MNTFLIPSAVRTALSVLTFATSAALSAAPLQIFDFHTDIYANWDSENETLALNWRVSDSGYNNGIPSLISPAGGIGYVAPGFQVSAPAGWETFGASPGAPLWIGWADYTPGTLHLGFAADFPSASGFDGDVSFSLQSVTGPGQVILAAYSDVVWASASPGYDTLTVTRSGHHHFDWLFTQQGLYTLTINASVLKDGQLVNVTENFSFQVGAIPEPSAFAMALGALALVVSATARRARR